MRYIRSPYVKLFKMADGSGVLHKREGDQAFAVNSEAVAIWQARNSWDHHELADWLVEHGRKRH